jgi:hypothetical protein
MAIQGGYAPPGVYTQTVFDSPLPSSNFTGQIPLLLGAGKETIQSVGVQMIRGSSSSVDQRIVNENMSGRAVLGFNPDGTPILGNFNGTATKVQVQKFPMVDGTGGGVVATDSSSVTAYVNGIVTVVLSVDGAKGIVELAATPALTDTVLVSYYFKRTDTLIEDESLSSQITTTMAEITGSNGSFDFDALSNVFVFVVDGVQYSITLPTISTGNREDDLNRVVAIINSGSYGTLEASTYTDNFNLENLQLNASGSITIGNGSANAKLGLVVNQSTSRNKTFFTSHYPIVDGTNGGITTTDITDIVVKLNGATITPASVDGSNGSITLTEAPATDATLTVTYYFNSFRDQFDYIPSTGVLSVESVSLVSDGSGGSSSNFIEGISWILKDDKIVWGTSALVSAGETSLNATAFNDAQITASLKDDKIYLVQCERVIDTSVVPPRALPSTFKLPYQPVDGTGSGSPTSRADLVQVKVGYNFTDAIEKTDSVVARVNHVDSTITLAEEVEEGKEVFATFYYNTLTDSTIGGNNQYQFVCLSEGASGQGKYQVLKQGVALHDVTLSTKGSSLNGVDLSFPSGSELLPDARITTGTPVNETVTVKFASSNPTSASFISAGSSPYFTIKDTSDQINLSIDEVTVTGGVSLSSPTGDGRFGVLAHIVGDVLPYTVESGLQDLGTISAGNDSLQLKIDNQDIVVNIGTVANCTAQDIADAINIACNSVAPQYQAMTTLNGGVEIIANSHDTLSFQFIGSVHTAIGEVSITLTDAVYSTASALATELETKINEVLVDNLLQYEVNGVTQGVVVSVTANSSGRLVFSLDQVGKKFEIVDAVDIVAGEVYVILDTDAGNTDFTLVGSANNTIGTTFTADDDGSVLAGNGTVVHAIAELVEEDAGTFVVGETYTITVIGDTIWTNIGSPNNMLGTTFVATGVGAGSGKAERLVDVEDTYGYLEFVSQADPEDDFAIIAGIDTDDVDGLQTKFGFFPVAQVSSTSLGGSAVKERLILRNRFFMGNSYFLPSGELGVRIVAGSLLTKAGLKSSYSPAIKSAVVQQPTLKSIVGWSEQKTDDSQPAVKFYNGNNNSYPANNILLLDVNGTIVNVEFTSSATGILTCVGESILDGLVLISNSIVDQINNAFADAGVDSIVEATQEGAGIRIVGGGSAINSYLKVLNGSANDTLGLIANQTSTSTSVTASQIVSALMSHQSDTLTDLLFGEDVANDYFKSKAVAFVHTSATNKQYLAIESLSTGVGSIVDFTGGNAITTKGTGLKITTTDGAVGEDAKQGFYVKSSVSNGSGSANTSIFNSGDGQDGFIGQTYVDSVTGLTFTILAREGGVDYPQDANAFFKWNVSQNITCNANIPKNFVNGVSVIVSNTTGVSVGDTANLETFDKGGNEPDIGQVYYISYTQEKVDYTTKVFNSIADVVSEYGDVSTSNPLSLGAYLAILNGAGTIACKQIKRLPNTAEITETQMIEAIDSIEGGITAVLTPSVILPLIPASESLLSHISKHCDLQSSLRFRSERTAILGFASGTIPKEAGRLANLTGSSRVRVVYPDIASLTLTNATGTPVTYIVDGRYLACAVAGTTTSINIDVATPWESRQVNGFNGVLRNLTPVEANSTAVKGVSILENAGTTIKIRHGLTTNMSSVLTKTPTIIQIADQVQRNMRNVLDGFIGVKNLPVIQSQVLLAVNNEFQRLVLGGIIESYTGLEVVQDPEDATGLQVNAFYKPVFPLLYIQFTFNVRSNG